MQLTRMQKLSCQSGEPIAMVEHIARQGMTERSEVDPDLVGATGIQPGLQKGVARKFFDDAVMSAGGSLADAVDPHAPAVVGVSADGRVDLTLTGSDNPRRQGTIVTAGGARRDLKLEMFSGIVVESDNHETGCVFVEAMHNARPIGATHRGGSREPCHQRVGERPGAVARRRMDDQSGRFIDDRQVGILIDDRKWHLFGLRRQGRSARATSPLTRSPAASRIDGLTATPFTRTCPFRTRAAAAERESAPCSARNTSSRAPASSEETTARSCSVI